MTYERSHDPGEKVKVKERDGNEKGKSSHLAYSFSFDATFQLNWNMCKIGTQIA